MARPRPLFPGAQRGVSMIELMVALALGMMVVATIGYAYLGTKQNFKTLEAMSRMQESARYAFEAMSRDLRMAGFTGCSYNTVTNTLNSTSTWYLDLLGTPLKGYDAGDTFPSGVSSVLRGDGLTVLRADNETEYLIASHNPSSAVLTLTTTHDIDDGAVLVATDCDHAAIFQASTTSKASKTITHNTGGTVSPGNCTKGFGIPASAVDAARFTPWSECTTTPTLTHCNPGSTCDTNGTAKSMAGGKLLRLSAVTYHIRANAAGEPALYRQTLGSSGTSAMEVAEGVEDMQLTYGQDTDGDGAVDQYRTTAAAVTDWSQVLSVRVSLLMVSRATEAVTTEPQAYTYNGATTTPNDRLLRKVITTYIALRNRL